MKTIKKEKTRSRSSEQIDAVKMMREIRDKITAETENMTFSELKNYIQKNFKKVI